MGGGFEGAWRACMHARAWANKDLSLSLIHTRGGQSGASSNNCAGGRGLSLRPPGVASCVTNLSHSCVTNLGRGLCLRVFCLRKHCSPFACFLFA